MRKVSFVTMMALLLLNSFSLAWISATNTKFIMNSFARRTEKLFKGQTSKCFMGKDYDYSGFVGKNNTPIFRLHIDETYNLSPSANRVTELIQWTKNNSLTDLWVVCHGWLTTADDAFTYNYEVLFREFGDLVKQPEYEQELKGKTFGIVGITWNSLTRKAEENWNILYGREEMSLVQKLTRFFSQFNAPLKGEMFPTHEQPLKPMYKKPGYEELDAASRALKSELLNMFDADEGWLIDQEAGNNEVGPDFDAIYKWIGRMFNARPMSGGGDDSTANIGRERPKATRADIGAYFTFRVMKGRTAQSGLRTLSGVMTTLHKENSALHIHLVGHSFGALLVSAAANNGKPGDYSSMTLLQGAFSKNAFAPIAFYKNRPGMFQNVISLDTVKGPITVTHTQKDRKDGALYRPYFIAAAFYRGLPFHGVEIPNFQPKAFELFDFLNFLQYFDLRAIGDEGVANVNDRIRIWNALSDFDPNICDDKVKFHNIDASDAIPDHNAVWTRDVALLLLKVAQANVNNKDSES